MDELFNYNFEHYNFLCEIGAFEHFVNHDPQSRKCSDILDFDIDKFMFTCSQCDSVFENADDFRGHQMLEHQGQKTQTDLDYDTWFEKELLRQLLDEPEPTLQLKEFYESVDKIIDIDVTHTTDENNEHLVTSSNFFNSSSNDSVESNPSISEQITFHQSECMLTSDIKQSDQIVSSIPSLSNEATDQDIFSDENSITTIKSTSNRKRKKKRTPGQCDVCNRSFNDTYNLRIHKMIHTGEMPFKCEDCGKGFRQYNKLKIHSIIHTNKKPFVCDVCSKGFRFRNYLAIHKRLHTGEKPYKCKLCDEHFHSLHNRRLHFKSTHLHEKENLTCTFCGKTLSTKFYLQVHTKRHNNQKDFKCEYCEDAFYTVGQLKAHMTTHEDTKPFQCKLCQVSFQKKSTYNQHLEIHSKTNPHFTGL